VPRRAHSRVVAIAAAVAVVGVCKCSSKLGTHTRSRARMAGSFSTFIRVVGTKAYPGCTYGVRGAGPFVISFHTMLNSQLRTNDGRAIRRSPKRRSRSVVSRPRNDRGVHRSRLSRSLSARALSVRCSIHQDNCQTVRMPKLRWIIIHPS